MVYKRRSIFLIWILLSFFAKNINAQDTSDANKKSNITRPQLAVTFVPTAFLNYTPGIQFGVEIATKAEQSLNFEIGYLSLFDGRSESFKGYRWVGEYRFYNPLKNKPKRYNSYIGGQIHLKQTFLSGLGLFSRDNGSYTQMLDYRVTNTTSNALVVIGELFPIKKRWFLDIAFRAGIRFLDVRFKDVPTDAEIINNNADFLGFIMNREGYRFFPKAAYSLKVVYLLN